MLEKIYLLVPLALLLFCSNGSAQPPSIIAVDDNGQPIKQGPVTWTSAKDSTTLKIVRLVYKKPKRFQEVLGFDCFKNDAKLESILRCAANKLESKDGEFLVFMWIDRPFTKEDSIDMKKRFPRMDFDPFDKIHMNMIRVGVLASRDLDVSLYGKNAGFDWRKHVTYLAHSEAKKKFNSDTAIKVPLPLKKEEAYLGKYNNLTGLVLQKNGRGFVMIYCFYTDKAKRKLDYYWKQVEGIFSYED